MFDYYIGCYSCSGWRSEESRIRDPDTNTATSISYNIERTPNPESPSEKGNNTYLTTDETGLSEHSSPQSSSSWDDEGSSSWKENHQPRRGTRIRQQFDPHCMPSGTQEMEELTKWIEQDSDDEDQEVLPERLEALGACMAIQVAEDGVPKT